AVKGRIIDLVRETTCGPFASSSSSGALLECVIMVVSTLAHAKNEENRGRRCLFSQSIYESRGVRFWH
ncbi:MAG: hypothetical protein WBW37_12580, partial [Methyloceanibacter sp.]